MNNTREKILARISQTTRQQTSLEQSQQLVRNRLSRHQRGPLPAYTETLIDRFTARAQQASTSVVKIQNASEAADAITHYIEEHKLANKIIAAPSTLLDEITWPAGIVVERRIAQASDEVAV